MKAQTLRDIFFCYLDNTFKEKNSNRKFENLLKDYLEIYKEVSEIYECNEYYRVYKNQNNNLCRVVILTDSKHSGIDFITKEMKEFKDEILFSKNCILIQRKLNFENWNPIKSIFDWSEIKESIQEAEIKSNNVK